MNRWDLMAASLNGDPWPAPPDLPGRVVTARDEPLAPEYLAGISSPTELGLVLGISRQAADLRLRAATTTTTDNHEGTPPCKPSNTSF